MTGAGTALSIAFAGCSGGDGNGGGTKFNEMEIMTAWASGDGGAAFDALHKGFQNKYPKIKTSINDNPGGAGTGLATALDTRMFNNNPPSTWGFFPGPSLTPYADADLLGSITESVWKKRNLSDVVPEYLKSLNYFENIGHIGVPLEFNRINNLFYNVNLVEKAGIDPASISSPTELIEAMKQVEDSTDAVGMAQSTKSPWTVFQLWESMLVSEYGYDVYTSYINGDVAKHKKEIKGTLQLLADYRKFFNEDAGSINFTEAASTFISGEAAFFNQGDWAVGNFDQANDFKYDSDWQHVAFPGSSDVFLGQNSSFMYPSNNPSPEATVRWLRWCGTKEGQIRFNAIKGGVPCRTDAPMDDEDYSFNAHQKFQYEAFQNASNLNGTIAHNNVVVPQIKSDMYSVFSTFKGSWNVDKAYNGMVDAFDV